MDPGVGPLRRTAARLAAGLRVAAHGGVRRLAHAVSAHPALVAPAVRLLEMFPTLKLRLRRMVLHRAPAANHLGELDDAQLRVLADLREAVRSSERSSS